MPKATSDRATGIFSMFGPRKPPMLWLVGSSHAPPSGPFVALVPGAEAPLLRVTLPDTLKGSAREGVALRQIHDRIGMGAGPLVLRPARLGQPGDAWGAVLAAARDAVAGWQAQVQGMRGRCRAVLPDYLALPTAPGLWTVQVSPGPDGASVQARLGVGDGFSAEAPLAAHLLTQALERARAVGALPAAVLRLGGPEGTIDQALAGLRAHPSPEALPPALPRPRVLGHGELALDLRHDPRAVSEVAQARLTGLRWPLLLATLGLAGWAGATELETRRDLAHAEAITIATIDAVRRDFLPSGPLLDIPVQVSRALEQRRNPAGNNPDQRAPLDLLHAVSSRLATRPQALRMLSFQSGSGFTLELHVPDFATFEALLDDLRADAVPLHVVRSGSEPDGSASATVIVGSEGAQ